VEERGVERFVFSVQILSSRESKKNPIIAMAWSLTMDSAQGLVSSLKGGYILYMDYKVKIKCTQLFSLSLQNWVLLAWYFGCVKE
jgi:hypothetical protein